MRFFLVWECYDDSFHLIEKGHHFLFVVDPENIDIEVGDYVEAMAQARNMNPFYFVISQCQPLPSTK